MKNLKKSILLAMLLVLTFTFKVSASSDVYLVIDGKLIVDGSPALIENDRTIVPVRFVAENLGYNVSWNGDSKTVSIVDPKTSKKIELTVDSKIAKTYDENSNLKKIKLDTPAKNTYGRVYVPVRFIAESFGTQVTWDDDWETVIIGDPNKFNEDIIKNYLNQNFPKQYPDLGSKKIPVEYFYMEGFFHSNEGAKMYISSDDVDPIGGFSDYCQITRGRNEETVYGFYIRKTPDKNILETMCEKGCKGHIEIINQNCLKLDGELFYRLFY